MVEATLAATGDAHAFERLYRAHVARIHSLARRMLSEDEADETTQDVFVRAWQKLGTFRGETPFTYASRTTATSACSVRFRGSNIAGK